MLKYQNKSIIFITTNKNKKENFYAKKSFPHLEDANGARNTWINILKNS